MNKELLRKYLNNTCSEEELDKVIRWIKNDIHLESEKKIVVDDWEAYNEEQNLIEDGKFIKMFDEIQKRLKNSDFAQKQEKNKVISLGSTLSWVTKVAAVLLLPILAILIYTKSEYNSFVEMNQILLKDSLEVYSPVGSITVVELSDGTKVHLNHGSTLKYPQQFAESSREVTLKGEGFFEVVHNPQKPFVVNAERLRVKALGTTFNVLAYSGMSGIETTLVNGKVQLEKIIDGHQVSTIATMKPSQRLVYNRTTGKVTSMQGDIKKYIAWKDGFLIFEETPIVDVVNKLSRSYNVEFHLDSMVEQYTYTVTLENEPLSQILDLMTIATPIRYNILPRTKNEDGSYSKQRIIISHK